MVFSVTFNIIYFSYIVVVSFIGGRNQSAWKKHWPVASYWQTLSHNVVLNTPRHDQDTNSQRVVIGTDCIGTCKSYYYTITTMMALICNMIYPQ